MIDTLIRPALAADVDSLGRLGALMVQEHHDFDGRRFLPAAANTPELYGSFLQTQLNDPHAIVLVAEDEGRVIGYAYGTLEGYDYMALRGPAAVVHDLIVDPEYRSRGVGRALLNAIITALSTHDVPRVLLSTAERNASAQRFFEGMGFRRTMVEMTRELDQ